MPSLDRSSAEARHYAHVHKWIHDAGSGSWEWSSEEEEDWGERPSMIIKDWECGEDIGVGLDKWDAKVAREMVIDTVLRANSIGKDGRRRRSSVGYRGKENGRWDEGVLRRARAPRGSLGFHRGFVGKRRDGGERVNGESEEDSGYESDFGEEFEGNFEDSESGREKKMGNGNGKDVDGKDDANNTVVDDFLFQLTNDPSSLF